MKNDEKAAQKKSAQARQKAAKSTPKTQRDLAALLGISPQLLNYHIQQGGTPDLEDVQGWLTFMADGREGSLPEDLRRDIGEARARLIRAQAVRVERENVRAAGDTVSRDEVRSSISAAMSLLFGQLEQSLINELPLDLAHLNSVQIAERCRGAIDELKAKLREAFAPYAEAKAEVNLISGSPQPEPQNP